MFGAGWRLAALLTAVLPASAPQDALGIKPSALGPHLGGKIPYAAPRPSDRWTLVDAFPSLRSNDAIGLVPIPCSNRLLVHCRQGDSYCFENDSGVKGAEPFLDLTPHCQGWDDSGFLGIASHPDFGKPGSPNRGYVYVWYNDAPEPWRGPGRPSKPIQGMTSRLARFTVPDGASVPDRASERVLIDQRDDHMWHNGGGMFFNLDDGFLYISLGDEGGSFGNEQRIDRDLFSGVIRIDVDQNPKKSRPILTVALDG